MKQLKLFSSFLVLIFILSSCSLEKKIYSSGFHVEWNGNSRKSETEIKKDKLVSSKKNKIGENKFENKKVFAITKLFLKNQLPNFQKTKYAYSKNTKESFHQNNRDSTQHKLNHKPTKGNATNNNQVCLWFALALLIITVIMLFVGFWFYCLIPLAGIIFLFIAFFAKKRAISSPIDHKNKVIDQRPSATSIISLLLGLLGILFSTLLLAVFLLAPIVGLLAIVLSCVEIWRIRRFGERKKGTALIIVALILGAIALSFWFPFLFLVF